VCLWVYAYYVSIAMFMHGVCTYACFVGVLYTFVCMCVFIDTHEHVYLCVHTCGYMHMCLCACV
jgi:hypothetical protein